MNGGSLVALVYHVCRSDLAGYLDDFRTFVE
jgi:hypothetical protein